jgi:hypothetical protein
MAGRSQTTRSGGTPKRTRTARPASAAGAATRAGQQGAGRTPAGRAASTEGGISDAAVREATGQGWAQWFALLDEAGGRERGHKGIVALLHPRHLRSGWWSQMVTVAYEQARGLRKQYETPDGYQVGGSRTVAVPVAQLYGAFAVPAARRTWLGKDAGLTVRKATRNKSLRITWVDGRTHVDANFYARGSGRSMVALQHGKLRNAAEAKRMKAYWSRALARLKTGLET